MGLITSTGRNTTFLVIKHNSLCLESNVPQEGYEPVDVTNPQTNEVTTKFIKKFDGVWGYLDSIEWHDTEQKYKTRFRSWKVTLRDGADLFTLEFPLKDPNKFSPTFTVFAMFAGNIDFTQPVSFHAWHDKREDRLAFGARQGEVWVPRMFTKKNPGDCPFPEAGELGGGSWQATNLFLRNYVVNTVIPKCKAAAEARAAAEPPQADPLPRSEVSGALSASTAAVQAQAPAGRNAPDDPFGDDFDNIPVGEPPPQATKPGFTDDIPF